MKVTFPSSLSEPMGLPNYAASPHTSSMSSRIWKASPSSWAYVSAAAISPPLPPAAAKARIEELRRAAKADLPARIERLSQLTGLKYAKLTIRASRTKWGSCSGRNTISLSLFLMTLPEHLRDYVIVHELCHTVHHNHSPRFHALVDRMVGGNEKALNRELRAFAIR